MITFALNKVHCLCIRIEPLFLSWTNDLFLALIECNLDKPDIMKILKKILSDLIAIERKNYDWIDAHRPLHSCTYMEERVILVLNMIEVLTEHCRAKLTICEVDCSGMTGN